MRTAVTIIGYGTMGQAIGRELMKDSSVRVFAVDKNKKNQRGLKDSLFVILSVKPQDADTAIKEVKGVGLYKDAILISIMAGFPIKKIAHLFGHKKIVRVMPNLGLSAGEGIAAWKSVGLSLLEKKKVKNFLDKVTENFEVKDEDTIDKVTAISGSGPAYFFLLAENLLKSAKGLGFRENEAKKLVEKTFSAAAILAKDSNYSELIKRVASKGGTTEAALKIFARKNFEGLVANAVKAAYERAKKLSHA